MISPYQCRLKLFFFNIYYDVSIKLNPSSQHPKEGWLSSYFYPCQQPQHVVSALSRSSRWCRRHLFAYLCNERVGVQKLLQEAFVTITTFLVAAEGDRSFLCKPTKQLLCFFHRLQAKYPDIRTSSRL